MCRNNEIIEALQAALAGGGEVVGCDTGGAITPKLHTRRGQEDLERRAGKT